MSKTTAPLLSFEARGQLGETLVYSSWKGRPYARRYVIPANPQTAAQTLTRNTFRALNNIWRYMPAGATAAWTKYGDNSRFTARNGWLKQNVSPLRESADLEPILLSVAAGGGLSAADVTLTPGAETITVALEAPTLPAGWSITAAHALAIENISPQADATPEVVSETTATEPWSLLLEGLTTGTEYVVGGWFAYETATGQTAYGASVQGLATPT